MKLKLKAYSPSDSKTGFEYGTMVLKDNILLEFIEDEIENVKFLKDKYGEHFFPIKPNTYVVEFLDETNEQYKVFKARININNSLPIYFYVKLSPTEKQQLKWMNKQKWIQKGNNLWIVLPFIVSILGLLIMYIVS